MPQPSILQRGKYGRPSNPGSASGASVGAARNRLSYNPNSHAPLQESSSRDR